MGENLEGEDDVYCFVVIGQFVFLYYRDFSKMLGVVVLVVEEYMF